MTFTFLRSCNAVLALCVAGCAGQITTQTGVDGRTGSALVANAPIKVVSAPGDLDESANLAKAAVMQALAMQGHTNSEEAGVQIEVAIAERSAPVALTDVSGKDISPSRKRKFLQSCAYRIQRLTIAVYSIEQPGITKVWAEERHCKAKLNEVIPALAQRAVALLEKPELAGATRRSGKN